MHPGKKKTSLSLRTHLVNGEIPSTMKQIQYHITGPLHKTILRPNDNAVIIISRKSLENMCFRGILPLQAPAGLQGGQESITGWQEESSHLQCLHVPSSLECTSWWSLCRWYTSLISASIMHVKSPCDWLPLRKFHRFSCAPISDVNLILPKWFQPPCKDQHAPKENLVC